MSSKTISLKEETYERLRRAKGEGESFSDVIDRLLGDDEHPLYGLVGLLAEDEADRLRERSRAFREEANASVPSMR
ncbi:RHH/copG family antitoxin [Halapricum desulfuricans]|uniref:RHH/copG family antitoxin n=1 Tax=Halapricum desulfuricans TaxID=2841257 RepID=A0A897NCI1_9EURY|nr:antitoxin VapB family protein [Halapricum desulfuricans]QSG12120.1 RHH/copG family antitoxin [Halapricum desulfuricans]